MKGLSALVLAFVVFLSGCRYTGETSPAGSPANSGSSEVSEKAGEIPEEFSGEWYLLDFSGSSEPQKWEFRSGGILIAGDEEHEWKAVKPLLGNKKLYIDGSRYEYSRYDDALYIYDDKFGGPFYSLYTTDSERFLEYLKQREEQERSRRLTEECSELFSRYPDSDGWIDSMYTGDIPFLADPDIIDRMLRDGFVVSTPEELASCCWYMNTNDSWGLLVTIAGDIDLSGYEWAPMGWSKPHGGYAFRGYIDGGGHTIKNMKMNYGDVVDTGFIGYGLNCSVSDICFDGAEVGGYNSGIVIGDSICCALCNVTAVNSSVSGVRAGALVGWDAHNTMENCSADVTVNGEKAEQLSWNESEKSGIVVENVVEITLDENYVAHRPSDVEGYEVYSWVIERDGRELYCNSALGSCTYECQHSYPGTYKVYLQSWINGQYMPISNIISYTIE